MTETENAEADRLENEAEALQEQAEALEDEMDAIRLKARKLDEQARELRHGPLVPAAELTKRHSLAPGVLSEAIRRRAVHGFWQNRRLLAFERDVARWVAEGCPTAREPDPDVEAFDRCAEGGQ